LLAAVMAACSSRQVALEAADLSDGYVRARVDEEYAVAETCSSLEQMSFDQGALQPAARALVDRELALRLDLLLRASGINARACSPSALRDLVACEGGELPCSPAAAACTSEIEHVEQPSGDHKAMLSVIGFTADPRGTSPESATLAGARALRTSPAVVARQVNLSFATVMALLSFSERAERLAHDTARSFVWFEGFARPLLEVAAAELVAASLDSVLDRLEQQQAVTRASVSSQACRLYDKLDTSSAVRARVLRRAILRFSAFDYDRHSEPAQACRELERAARSAGLDADEAAICRQIRRGLRTSSRSEDLRPRLKVRSGRKEPARLGDQHVAALRRAAGLCLAEYGERASESCTLGRIDQVASLLAATSGSPDHGSPPTPMADGADAKRLGGARFGILERQASLLSARLLAVEAKLDALQAELGQCQEAMDRSTAHALSGQGRVEAKLDVLERHLVRDTMVFAGRAGQACRQYVHGVLGRRNALAQELGLEARGAPVTAPCSQYDEQYPARGDELYAATRFRGVFVRREELCGSRFVGLSLTIDFAPGLSEPSEESRNALAWLARTIQGGDTVALIAYGDDAVRSKALFDAYDDLPNRAKERFTKPSSAANALAILRAARVAMELGAASTSMSTGGGKAQRVEVAVLLGGKYAFDPLHNCPDWPAAR
jgi:hypothetical protein